MVFFVLDWMLERKLLFFKKKCVPTKFGMKVPDDAYFQNVNLFPDLPTIHFQKPQSVQNIMQLLGVRKVKQN